MTTWRADVVGHNPIGETVRGTSSLSAIDRREATALAASPGPWMPNAEHDEVLAADEITAFEGFALSGYQLRATVDHAVLNDPTAVIRMCQAHRKIVDEFKEAQAYYTANPREPAGEVTGLWSALKALAEGYGLTTKEGE